MAKSFKDFCKQKAAPPDGGLPYKAKGPVKAKKELADMGSQPKYTPGKVKAGKKAEQIKESFLDATSRMSPKQFVQFMKKTTGNPAVVYETASSTSRVMKDNPGAARALVYECKRNGTFNRLVYEMLLHREFYDAFAYAMGSQKLGKSVSRSLVRAMNEMVGPPAPGGDDSHQPPPLKAGKHAPPGHGLGADEEEEDDMPFDELGDDLSGMDDDMGGMDDPGMGGPGMGDEMGDDLGMGLGHDHPALGGFGGGEDDLGGLDFGDEPEGEEDDSLENKHKDDPDDDEHEDDEEEEEEEEKGNPFAKKGAGQDGPSPSLMSRMMRREHTNPAVANFRKALKTYNG